MVKIYNFYDVSEASWLYKILQEHLSLMKKHIDGVNGVFEPNLQTLINDCRCFYTRWKGDKSPFVSSMTKIIYQATLKRMSDNCWCGTLDFTDFSIKSSNHINNWNEAKAEIPKLYYEIWTFLVNNINGQNGIMDDDFFDNVFKKIQKSSFIYGLEFLGGSLYSACLELIEAHYRAEEKHPFNMAAV